MWISEKDEKRIFYPELMVAFAIAALFLFPFLSIVPGLHGDEAWVGIRAYDILHGARPVLGMNNYTGPIYQYLVAPLLGILGFQVYVLRLVTALASLGCVFLYFHINKRLFDRLTAALATLGLFFLPFFTAYGRIAHEVFALNPILALGSIFFLLEAREQYLIWSKISLCVASGVCMGLGIWNHAIFISVPLALAVTALFHSKRAFFHSASTYWAALGLLLGLLPRLVLFFHSAELNGTLLVTRSGLITWIGVLLSRLQEWSILFFEIAHGDILFQRFAGEVIFKTPNFPILTLFLMGLGIVIRNSFMSKEQGNRNGILAVIFSISLFLTTLVLCPGNSDRYFLLILYLIPIFIAFFFRELLRVFIPKKLVFFLFGVLICLHLARTSINYFISQIRSQGKTSYFFLGSQPETSNHFIRTDRLYQELVSSGAQDVFAEFFITVPLQFYDLEQRHFRNLTNVDMAPSALENFPIRAYAVVYSDGLRRVGPEHYLGFKTIFRDSHFQILNRDFSKADADF